MNISLLDTESGRQRALAFAIRLTYGTSLAPLVHEQELLNRFVLGELSLDELCALLETPTVG